MKKNLGNSVLFILLFLSLNLQASEYKWGVWANKEEAYVNQAIHLRYTCSFEDTAELYVIEFNPTVDNENYKIEILRETEKIVDRKRINEYEFILFVKKAGAFTLALDTLMKKTNKDSIENGMLGRDNANYEEFSLFPYKQKTVLLNILETPSSMVGEFSLSVKKDATEIEAYKPYHLEFLVSGVGDFQVFKDVDIKIEGVEVFSEAANEKIELAENGYKGIWQKKFAFVSNKSFDIPSWQVKYFDLQEKRVKVLKFEGLSITVKPPGFQKEKLLDPPEKSFEFDKTYLYYLLTFIAGFLVAKIKFSKKKPKDVEEELFCKRVQDANSLEKLSFILVAKDAVKYEKILSQIDSKELTSLSHAKNLICN